MGSLKRAIETLVAAVTVSLFCFGLAEAKKPDNAGGSDGGSGSNTFEYDVYQLDSVAGAYSGYAADLNEGGLIVGEAVDLATNVPFAAYWDVTVAADGTVTSYLSFLPGSSGTRATGVNNLGQIVGDAPLLGGPGLYWSSVTSQPLSLPPLAGDTSALPHRINDAGIICGLSFGSEEHPVVWRATSDNDGNPIVSGPFPLPGVNGHAWDLSEPDADGTCTVAGKAWDGQSNAVVTWRVQPQSNGGVWIDPQPTILQVGVNVYGVNNGGVVCGDSSRPDWIAMLWTATEQIPLALPRRFASSGAWDLNDSGVVVGWVSEQIGFPPGEAAVWAGPDAKPVLLGSFLSPKSPFVGLTDAPAINEAGVIVGAGWDGNDGVEQAFIATPR